MQNPPLSGIGGSHSGPPAGPKQLSFSLALPNDGAKRVGKPSDDMEPMADTIHRH